MFRTIFIRSGFVKVNIRKAVRANLVRNLCIHGAKRTTKFNKFGVINYPNLKWTYQIRHYASDLPGHTKVTLPALSPTMEMGTIISWAKKEGDKLNEGDLLAEIETDKATMGFETPEEGYLAKILIPAGTKEVPIGKLVCIIVENQEDVAAFKDFKDDGSAAPARVAKAASPPPAAVPSASAPVLPVAPAQPTSSAVADGRVYASPMAKRLAEQRNIRLQGKGTGLFDSITSADLDKLAGASAPVPSAVVSATPAPPPGASFVDIPLTSIRQTIAKRLVASKTTIPHYYLTIDVQVDKMVSLRSKINKKLEKSGVKLSLNDFIIKAVAQALLKVPEANSAWMESFIRQYKNADISVAVSTPTGLITPIVFEANNKGVIQISKEVKELAVKARENKLKPQEFQGGTFSVSNLGMFGIDHFCAIINPPQSCILAIGQTVTKLVPEKSDKGFKEAQILSLTLSSDHRVVDGAVGAKFLQALRDNMEDPVNMIL